MHMTENQDISDVCADCSALSPQWASVNRGVLLCDECSAVHRQLGRHISQVKHLKKSRWRSTQLEMVRYLAAACANRYWEHVLYEPITRKPNPTDAMHPTKADFIREKYLFLGFFKKPRSINLDDLNQQLHASVRTSVLETMASQIRTHRNTFYGHCEDNMVEESQPHPQTSPMIVPDRLFNKTIPVCAQLLYCIVLCITFASTGAHISVKKHTR
ncbi:unnamed protein product [Echinostoma caproni]|uniref:Arf-GAP domain-containing protein n=1 Tax=Echinostoma caproni TaxID=27848 RepID=A0A183A3N4_9TREM|nr:unnamed protein product [Echinostoma caproni]